MERSHRSRDTRKQNDTVVLQIILSVDKRIDRFPYALQLPERHHQDDPADCGDQICPPFVVLLR